MVRQRTTTVAMHLLRRLLLGSRVSARRAPRLRLFVALDLPGAARAALARFRDAAADPAVWRPLPEESFHVTLAFLGQAAERTSSASSRCCAAGAVVRAGAGARRRAAPAAAARARADGRAGRPRRRPRRAAGGRRRGAGRGGPVRARGATVPPARDGRAAALRRPRAARSPPRPRRSRSRAGAVTLYRSLLGRGGAVYEPLFARPGDALQSGAGCGAAGDHDSGARRDGLLALARRPRRSGAGALSRGRRGEVQRRCASRSTAPARSPGASTCTSRAWRSRAGAAAS